MKVDTLFQKKISLNHTNERFLKMVRFCGIRFRDIIFLQTLIHVVLMQDCQLEELSMVTARAGDDVVFVSNSYDSSAYRVYLYLASTGRYSRVAQYLVYKPDRVNIHYTAPNVHVEVHLVEPFERYIKIKTTTITMSNVIEADSGVYTLYDRQLDQTINCWMLYVLELNTDSEDSRMLVYVFASLMTVSVLITVALTVCLCRHNLGSLSRPAFLRRRVPQTDAVEMGTDNVTASVPDDNADRSNGTYQDLQIRGGTENMYDGGMGVETDAVEMGAANVVASIPDGSTDRPNATYQDLQSTDCQENMYDGISTGLNESSNVMPLLKVVEI